MSYTQEQLDTLRSAVARGVKSVSMNGETVVYGSIQEMLSLIAMMERNLGSTRGPILRTMPTDRGFGR